MEGLLKGCLRISLSPVGPQLKPQSLTNLCLRTAAVYTVTSLYDFHQKQSSHHVVEPEEIQVNTNLAEYAKCFFWPSLTLC